MTTTDVLVVGGGIAGVSAAYHLAAERRVLLVEAEPRLAYHTTGRSAALFFENYGAGPVRPLTRGSKEFLFHPPEELADHPLVSARGALTVARPRRAARLDEVAREGEEMGADVRRLTPEDCRDLVPVLRTDLLHGGLWEPEAADMDVAAIHQSFVRGLRRDGAEIRTSAPVTALIPDGSGWRIRAGDDDVHAAVVVDAAGAWCDAVADLAGVAPIGLQPMRRTAFMIPGDEAWREWPMAVDVDHDWYFKPDGVQLLCSPADETPSEPCDARPREEDVALAIERINAATTLGIRSVRSAWAGLRSFVPDRAMVIGFDPDAPGFFWLAGQGGTGIQTAPAAGRLAAALVVSGAPPEDLVALGLDMGSLSPARLRSPR